MKAVLSILVFIAAIIRLSGQVIHPEGLAQPLPLYLNHLQVYADESNKLNAEQAAQKQYHPFAYFFSKIPDHLPINKTWWLKLEVQNQYGHDTTVVFYPGFQNYVHAYYADSGRFTPVAHAGNMLPASQLSIPAFRQALYLPLVQGKRNTFYISIYNRTTYHTDPLKPFLMSKASLNDIQLKSLQENRITDFIFMIGMGIFLIMIVYLLIKWIYLKDRAYFYYALSLFGGAVFYLTSFIETGNNMLFLEEKPHLVYMFADAFAFISIFGYWQFVRKFLYIDREKRVLGKYMKVSAYTILVYMLFSLLYVVVTGNIWNSIIMNTTFGFIMLVAGLYVLFGIRKLNQPLKRIIYGGIIITIIFYFIASLYEVVRGTRYEFLPELGGGAPIVMLGNILQMLFSVIGLAYRNKLESMEAADFKIQKSEAEMKALRAQMNPHFIFNCMHTIDAYIFKEQPEKASAFLNKFSKLVRQTLENSEQQLIPLTKELYSLRLYTELEQERYDGSFEVHFDIDDKAGDCKIPPLLLQPFAENAILHGLRHLQNKKGELRITVKHNAQGLRITISDNGIGRNASEEINRIKGKSHTSMALDLTRQRLKFYHQGKLREGGVLINDLATATQTGTEVVICLPEINNL
jgi:sensor histidine kinase YesM